MLPYAIAVAALSLGLCNAQFGGGGFGGGGLGGGGGCNINPQCFVPCPDYTLADAFPFVRQTPISCNDCQSLCNQLQVGGPPYTCASAVYDSSVGSCDIFAVADQSGGGGGGGGFRGFLRHKRQKTPHRQRYPGRIYLQPTGACAGQGGATTGSTGSSGGSSGSGAASGGATSAAGAPSTTTAASTTSTAASPSAKKKKAQKFNAQKVVRKDEGDSMCLVHRINGVKDCKSMGIRITKHGRQFCKPTADECASQP